ncbi:MAG: hypothetical protein ACI4GD_01265 [Lachnospiraceae bacterium]
MAKEIIHNIQNLTDLSWDIIRNSSGTAGSFLKAYDDLGARKKYYKLSNYNAVEGIVGHECVNHGWGEYIYEMLLVDYLIQNRDRHGANIEVLRNKTAKTLRLAPLFDHGLSFVFSSITETALEKVDVMADSRVQCCVGTGSTIENLKLIPKDKLPKVNPLKESDKQYIMEGLENILPEAWREKIWEMIWRRWEYYEGFCNQR